MLTIVAHEFDFINGDCGLISKLIFFTKIYEILRIITRFYDKKLFFTNQLFVCSSDIVLVKQGLCCRK